MYRHLLVPLDDSPLAVETVNQAVTFAKTLGAKVTFFHAQADYGASSIGALERVMSPATFNEHMAGEARAILAKAEVVARVAGVPHDSAVMTSDRPHEAILRRRRGARLRPDLHRLARPPRHQGADARLADAEGPPADDDSGAGVGGRKQSAATRRCSRRSRSIRDEHRSLAAVIHGLEFVVRAGARSGNAAVVSAAARDARITSRRFRRSCIIRRKTPTCSASCARARASSTRRSTSSSASMSTGTGSSRNWRGASTPTRPTRWRGLARIRGGRRAFCDIADPAHGARSQGHHPGRARAPDRARTGRRSARRSPQRRSALLGGQRRGVPRAVRADHQSRAGTGRKRAGAAPESTCNSTTHLGDARPCNNNRQQFRVRRRIADGRPRSP